KECCTGTARLTQTSLSSISTVGVAVSNSRAVVTAGTAVSVLRRHGNQPWRQKIVNRACRSVSSCHRRLLKTMLQLVNTGFAEARDSRWIPPTNPSLYQINTRVLLADLARSSKRPATLDDIPDLEIDRLAFDGFDWVWFLGVWQTGAAGRKISQENSEWRHEFQELLPDFCTNDVCGSCFAIQSYTVHSEFGGNLALEQLRRRVHERGMRL